MSRHRSHRRLLAHLLKHGYMVSDVSVLLHPSRDGDSPIIRFKGLLAHNPETNSLCHTFYDDRPHLHDFFLCPSINSALSVVFSVSHFSLDNPKHIKLQLIGWKQLAAFVSTLHRKL